MAFSSMRKPCDICGAVGFSEYLITCFGCKQACEHIYCMQAQVLNVSAMWFCESCQARDVNHVKTTNLGENDKHNLSVQPPSSKPLPRMLSRGSSFKHGETSKVKFIPTEEAALLTSGAKKKGSPLKGSPVAKSSTPSSSGMPKTGTSKAFLKIGNPISSSRPLPGCSKSATQPRVQFSTSPRSPSVKMPQVSLTAKSSSLVCRPSSTEMLAGAKHVKDDLFIQQPLYVSSRPGSCKVSFQQSEECIDKVCRSPSKSSRHPDSIFNTNTASPSNNKNLILGLDRTSGLNMQTFPGGVFHHVKNTSVNYHVGGLLSCSPTSDMGTQKEDLDLLEQGNLDDQSCTLPCSAEEVDMEIDMMGGRVVGIIDKPVARPVAFEVKNFSKFPLPNDAYVALSPQHVPLNSANVATNTAELPDLSIPDAPPGLITTVAAQQKASMKFNIDKWTYHKVEGASTLFTESFNSRDEICSSEKKALVGLSCEIPPVLFRL